MAGLSAPSATVYPQAEIVPLTMDKNEKNKPSFFLRLPRLVDRIFNDLFLRTSLLDSEKTAQTQKSFEDHTHKSAKFTRQVGDIAPIVSAIGFIILLGSTAIGIPQIQELAKFISSQVSPVSTMFTSDWQASANIHGNEASMKLQEYTDKSQKQQAQGSAKEDYKRLLQEAQNALLTASKSN